MHPPQVTHLITPAETAQLRAEMTRITSKDGGGTSVTYRHHTGQTVDAGTGVIVPAFTDFTLGSVAKTAEVDLENGIERGDNFFMLDAQILTITDASAADEIVDGNETWNVIRAERDPTSSVWRVQARRRKVVT